MAHVEVFRFRAQPGKRQNVIDVFERWSRGERPRGFEQSGLVSNLDDPEEFVAVVRFDTTENYKANSDRPETDQWFRTLRENLVADPEWFGGKVEVSSKA
jgi:heme-degrading monooxygenase HmoA